MATQVGVPMDRIEEVAFAQFPQLSGRRKQLAGTLSGGEQQMLALARAFATDPKLLLLDELSMGLAPIVVGQLYDKVRELAAAGLSILLVEQFARTALPIADSAAVVLQGVIAHQGSPAEMEEALSTSYLGAGRREAATRRGAKMHHGTAAAVGVRRHRGGGDEEPARGLTAAPSRHRAARATAPVTPGQRWIVGLGGGRAVRGGTGLLVADQVQAHDQLRPGPDVARRHAATDADRLGAAGTSCSRDLSVLKTQVGQRHHRAEPGQLAAPGRADVLVRRAGARDPAGVAHHLAADLPGRRRAGPERAGRRKAASAIAALNAVSASCTAAEASSG